MRRCDVVHGLQNMGRYPTYVSQEESGRKQGEEGTATGFWGGVERPYPHTHGAGPTRGHRMKGSSR